MITVTTKLLAAESRVEELAGLLVDLCKASLQTPGCRRSQVSRSAHDERRFLLLGVFDDSDAHAAYSNSPVFAEALPGLMDCLEGLPDIEIYEDI